MPLVGADWCLSLRVWHWRLKLFEEGCSWLRRMRAGVAMLGLRVGEMVTAVREGDGIEEIVGGEGNGVSGGEVKW